MYEITNERRSPQQGANNNEIKAQGIVQVTRVETSERALPFFIKHMKSTVFVDLQGKMIDYVHQIYRESRTKDDEVQVFDQKLRILIKQYLYKQATKNNCKKLWTGLTEIINTSVVHNTEDPAYKEILACVEKIGESIAYFNANRKGWNGNNIKPLTGVCSEEEKIQIAKEEVLRGLINGEVNEKGLKKIEQYTDADYLQVANNAIEEEIKSREQNYDFFVKVG